MILTGICTRILPGFSPGFPGISYDLIRIAYDFIKLFRGLALVSAGFWLRLDLALILAWPASDSA